MKQWDAINIRAGTGTTNSLGTEVDVCMGAISAKLAATNGNSAGQIPLPAD